MTDRPPGSTGTPGTPQTRPRGTPHRRPCLGGPDPTQPRRLIVGPPSFSTRPEGYRTAGVLALCLGCASGPGTDGRSTWVAKDSGGHRPPGPDRESRTGPDLLFVPSLLLWSSVALGLGVPARLSGWQRPWSVGAGTGETRRVSTRPRLRTTGRTDALDPSTGMEDSEPEEWTLSPHQ